MDRITYQLLSVIASISYYLLQLMVKQLCPNVFLFNIAVQMTNCQIQKTEMLQTLANLAIKVEFMHPWLILVVFLCVFSLMNNLLVDGDDGKL